MIKKVKYKYPYKPRARKSPITKELKAKHKAGVTLAPLDMALRKNIITSEMLGIKRPGGGLSAHMIDAVTGKRARQDIEPDQQITLEMLE